MGEVRETGTADAPAPEKQAVPNKYPLGTIYFYLTEGCNMRCRHCWIAPKYQSGAQTYPVLDFALFKSILEQAKAMRVNGVKLTGGEPLLHPDIMKILDLIRTHELQLTIETNGVLCTPEVSSAIAAGKNPFVSVSIDGADAETHEWVRGVKGSFESALAGVRNLAQAGLHPQVIMTMMRRNRFHMKDIVKLAEAAGAGSVKFNIMQPTARGETMHGAGENLTLEELLELGQWVERELRPSTKLRIYFDLPIAFRSLSSMLGESGDGCSRCGIMGILGVLADGSYALCGIGATVPEMVFGHAAKDRLDEIWNNSRVLKELREGLPGRLEGICHDCMMKNVCLGSCIAQNYYSSKSLWAPYWFCEAAVGRSLFPESRRNPGKTARAKPGDNAE